MSEARLCGQGAPREAEMTRTEEVAGEASLHNTSCVTYLDVPVFRNYLVNSKILGKKYYVKLHFHFHYKFSKIFLILGNIR
jgi:hypothetical protein